MKKEQYTRDDLLDILGSYLAVIKRDDGQYESVVLDDLQKSITYVLKTNDYNGRYVNYLED